MGGITAYRRGALEGQEQLRTRATEDAARQRQEEQDRLAAMYRQIESRLAERRQGAQEEQFKAEGPMREALARQREAAADKAKRAPDPGTRLIATAGGQEIVPNVPGQTFGPRPVSRGGGGGGTSAEQRLYQQIQQEARQRLARHDARLRSDRTYRRAVQGDPTRQRDESTEFNAVVNDRFRRGEVTQEQRDRWLPAVSPYGPRP